MNKDINSNKERSIKIFFIAPIQNKFQVRIPDKASVNIFIFVLTRQVEGGQKGNGCKKIYVHHAIYMSMAGCSRNKR